MPTNSVLIIGGGPAGLRAAEVASAAGARVTVCDAQRSVGRKFLIAGRGGLNLTHGEPVENFPARYVDEPDRWRDLLREFGPDDLRAWAGELGVETYVGTSGRVFPRGQKAAGLLRAWVRRLRANGVEFRIGARFAGLGREPEGWRAEFQTGETKFSLKLTRSFSRSVAPRGRKPAQTERGPRFWPFTEWTSLRGFRRTADGTSTGLPNCSCARKDCR